MSGLRSKVVIIDDSELAVEFAKDSLEAAGFDVVTRNSALGSSVVILRERPDIVLVDIAMPGLTGPGFVSMLRKQPQLQRTVIILYSGCSREELMAAAEGCGADGFISKSGDFEDLPRQLHAALKGARRSQ